jgi:uncharacterized membrane protein YkoI
MRTGKKVIIGAVFTALLMLPGWAAYAAHGDLEGSIQIKGTGEADLVNMAKISLDQALRDALQAVPGKALRAELEEENGYLVYGVEVVGVDHQITDVKVDAGNGTVLKTTPDKGDREDHEEQDSEHDHGKD